MAKSSLFDDYFEPTGNEWLLSRYYQNTEDRKFVFDHLAERVAKVYETNGLEAAESAAREYSGQSVVTPEREALALLNVKMATELHETYRAHIERSHVERSSWACLEPPPLKEIQKALINVETKAFEVAFDKLCADRPQLREAYSILARRGLSHSLLRSECEKWEGRFAEIRGEVAETVAGVQRAHETVRRKTIRETGRKYVDEIVRGVADVYGLRCRKKFQEELEGLLLSSKRRPRSLAMWFVGAIYDRSPR